MTEEKRFKCAMCNGVFVCGWTEEEAQAEYKKKFDLFPDAEKELVCDDCYRKMGFDE